MTDTTSTEASGQANRGAARRERWGIALLLGLVACDGRCGGSSAGTESSPPAPPDAQLEVPTPTAETPMKEVRVTLADVEDIPSGELRIVESPKYEVRKLGKPKVLMEGKHLRLPDTPWPLAPDRGFVLVQDGPNYESKVLEARLLDLRTGKVLAVLRTLYRPAYHVLGVALGEAEVDGALYEVLVHASDGQIVPLWPVEEGQERFVVINAGTGDAWVFEAQKNEEGAEGDPYPPYRYAYWGDLRKPPPEPKEAFALRLEDRDRSTPEGWLGPTWQDPAKAPRFLQVDSDDEECAKVELRPDGYECVPFGTWAMAGGWRGEVEVDRPLVMSNAEKGEAQVLELGKCVIEDVALDPPRAILDCQDPDDRFLWSPQKVVRLRAVAFGVHMWGRNRHIMSVTHYQEPEGVEAVRQTWLDLAGLRVVDSPRMSNVFSMFNDGWLVLREGALFTQVYVANPALDDAHRVPIDTRECFYRDSLALDGPWIVSTCAGEDESVKSMTLVDAERRQIRPMLILGEAWPMASQRVLIGSRRGRGGARILRWEVE